MKTNLYDTTNKEALEKGLSEMVDQKDARSILAILDRLKERE